jgi:hypothetical protein
VLRIIPLLKIRRLRPGLNPRTWVPEGSTLTPRPPKSLRNVVVMNSHVSILYLTKLISCDNDCITENVSYDCYSPYTSICQCMFVYYVHKNSNSVMCEHFTIMLKSIPYSVPFGIQYIGQHNMKHHCTWRLVFCHSPSHT